MCGIAGMVHAQPGRPVERAPLERMCDVLRHRGPDDRGVWLGDGVGLAHTRLSIIDLSAAGHQPMSNEDGTIHVVFNGEIYGFAELRRELEARGHRFRSHTDTEVLVHLYEEEGDDLVHRIDGMFAFAIWDAPRQRLLLARDRVGKKPLKYAELDGGLIFASELKALLATGLVSRDVDLDAVHDFLSLSYVPSPGTGFAAIHKLPAGHRLIWEKGRTRVERYWTLDYREKQQRSSEEWRSAVQHEVRAAVERRLIADVPLGAFLSGGIDSSIVVACMAEASSAPVETFSIGFEHEAYNELPFAREIADRYGTRHHEFVVDAQDAALLPELARHYEEPYADPSALPSYYLSRETRRHVTVALNGDGGDEGFAGYERYARVASWDERGWVVGAASRIAGGLARHLPSASWALERRVDGFAHLGSSDLALRYAWLMRMFSSSEQKRFYTSELRCQLERTARDRLAAWMSEPEAGSDTVDRLCFADVRGYLADELMVKMDLASMAHSLETRSPLLDHRVLELTAAMPSSERCPGGVLKGMLKSAFADAFPPGLLDRPKQGFALPLHDWFRGDLLPLARELLLSEDTRIRRYVRPAALEGLVAEHAEGRAQRGVLLWALAMLELWHREVVEGGANHG